LFFFLSQNVTNEVFNFAAPKMLHFHVAIAMQHSIAGLNAKQRTGTTIITSNVLFALKALNKRNIQDTLQCTNNHG